MPMFIVALCKSLVLHVFYTLVHLRSAESIQISQPHQVDLTANKNHNFQNHFTTIINQPTIVVNLLKNRQIHYSEFMILIQFLCQPRISQTKSVFTI